MGVYEYASEMSSPIPAGKAFKAFVLDSDTLIPKVVPQAIHSVELLQGDGGTGSIKKINFGSGSKYSYVKHRVDELDKEKLSYHYTIIEGDMIGEKVEKIENEIKIEASSDGSGSILKSSSKYYTIGEVVISEEDIKAAKAKSAGLFKAIQTYLLANPDA